jgi:hypothetical protein
MPTTWWECEPRRLARDQREMSAAFPMLTWLPEGAGGWAGRLPLWPFARPEPAGLDVLTSGNGLLVQLRYGHAYPAAVPSVIPLDPEPDLDTRTQQRWHVLGDGSLCLIRDPAQWTGRESVVELLLKAAGWRVEYALLTAGVLPEMSLNGIVTDTRHDHLIAQAVDHG